MSPDDPDAALVGRRADQRLLEESALPAVVGQPEALPASRARQPIVAAGAAMTGASLIAGIALVLIGVIVAFSSGADLIDGGLVALGIVLVSTHWGWVHMAELSATRADARRSLDVVARREAWLQAIAPHTYWEVHTEVDEDGAIAIVRQRYEPVAVGEDRFGFHRTEELRERHGAEEPAAAVTERAEQLRREAARATERELERYLSAADRHETEQLIADDERERLEARRAASRALSEQINANLRDAPLEE
jgi:hypothetical protein